MRQRRAALGGCHAHPGVQETNRRRCLVSARPARPLTRDRRGCDDHQRHRLQSGRPDHVHRRQPHQPDRSLRFRCQGGQCRQSSGDSAPAAGLGARWIRGRHGRRILDHHDRCRSCVQIPPGRHAGPGAAGPDFASDDGGFWRAEAGPAVLDHRQWTPQ